MKQEGFVGFHFPAVAFAQQVKTVNLEAKERRTPVLSRKWALCAKRGLYLRGRYDGTVSAER